MKHFSLCLWSVHGAPEEAQSRKLASILVWNHPAIVGLSADSWWTTRHDKTYKFYIYFAFSSVRSQSGFACFS